MADMNVRDFPAGLLEDAKAEAIQYKTTLRLLVIAAVEKFLDGERFEMPDWMKARQAKAGDITVKTLQAGYLSEAKRARRQAAKVDAVGPALSGGVGKVSTSAACPGVIVSREYAHMIGLPCQLGADHPGKCGPRTE